MSAEENGGRVQLLSALWHSPHRRSPVVESPSSALKERSSRKSRPRRPRQHLASQAMEEMRLHLCVWGTGRHLFACINNQRRRSDLSCGIGHLGWSLWYWHRAKTHSELGKAIVIVIAVLVAIGEVIHIASQSDFRPNVFPGDCDYGSTPTTSQFPPSQRIPKAQRTSKSLSSNRSRKRGKRRQWLEATVSCDVVAYDLTSMAMAIQ